MKYARILGVVLSVVVISLLVIQAAEATKPSKTILLTTGVFTGSCRDTVFEPSYYAGSYLNGLGYNALEAHCTPGQLDTDALIGLTPMTSDGVLTNLTAVRQNPEDGTVVFTLWVNGNPTSLSCIADTRNVPCRDGDHPISVRAGDLVGVKYYIVSGYVGDLNVSLDRQQLIDLK